MKVSCRKNCSGKTKELIRESLDKDIPILVFSSSKERSLKEKSIAYFSQLVKTIDYSEVKDYNGQVLIDDVDENIDALIRVAFGNPNINVAAVTLSA